MSKMSWLHAELSERASELGFESIEEAERNGYEISMDGMTPTLKPNASKQLELAHKAWAKERDDLLKEMRERVKAYKQHGYSYDMQLMEKAIQFIEKGEC